MEPPKKKARGSGGLPSLSLLEDDLESSIEVIDDDDLDTTVEYDHLASSQQLLDDLP